MRTLSELTVTFPNKAANRLAAMEVLGFIDAPAVATMAPGASTATHPGPPTSDVFADWAPHEAALARRHVRWAFYVWILIAGTALGVGAFWLWQRPLVVAQESRAAVLPAVAEMLTVIGGFPSLTGGDIDPAAVNIVLLELDDDLRTLLDAASSLPEGDAKALFIGAVTSAGEVHRLYATAYTYRIALLPALTPPLLETDPSLTTPEDAAAVFADWLATFDQVARNLPEGVSPEVDSALLEQTAALVSAQRGYLDALVDGDPELAAQTATAVGTSLNELETLLFDYLEATQETLDVLIEQVGTSLTRARLLLG
jgi:hypothetical protein